MQNFTLKNFKMLKLKFVIKILNYLSFYLLIVYLFQDLNQPSNFQGFKNTYWNRN